METMQVNIPRESLIETVEQLSSEDLAAFVNDVLELKARRSAPSVSIEEEELLGTTSPRH